MKTTELPASDESSGRCVQSMLPESSKMNRILGNTTAEEDVTIGLFAKSVVALHPARGRLSSDATSNEANWRRKYRIVKPAFMALLLASPITSK
ncbi:MAG: hypothetical protein AB7U30_00460 [Sulfuricellaceae bacterium]